MNPKGNIWLAGGKRSVGKTHTAMEIAQEFFLRSKVPKRIIVFDHTNNSSYIPYGLMPLTVDDLYFLPQQERIRGIVRSDDIDGFAQVVTEQVECCSILFDDCGVLFRGNLTKQREKLLKTPKNNCNELIFQAHSFREIAPALLEQANMYIVKETVDDPLYLPTKVIARQQIGQLLIDVIRENFTLESNKKWATRIYDTEDDEVWVRDKQTGIFSIVPGEDYFPFSNKKRILT